MKRYLPRMYQECTEQTFEKYGWRLGWILFLFFPNKKFLKLKNHFLQFKVYQVKHTLNEEILTGINFALGQISDLLPKLNYQLKYTANMQTYFC